ncbi:hypothetical protein NQ318_021723, partial [Aromia moschata]
DRLPKNLANCPHYAYIDDIYEILHEEYGNGKIEILDKLGQELINLLNKSNMEKSFLCLGGNFKEFLTTLGRNNGGEDEIFICAVSDNKSLELDFVTDRPVIAFLLVGMLKEISKIMYFTEITVSIHQDNRDKRHFTFEIKEISSSTEEDYPFPSLLTPACHQLPMNVVTFCKAFPWHFIIGQFIF